MHGLFDPGHLRAFPTAGAQATTRLTRRMTTVPNQRLDQVLVDHMLAAADIHLAPRDIMAKVSAQKMPSVSGVSGNRQTAMSV